MKLNLDKNLVNENNESLNFRFESTNHYQY